MKKLFTLFAAAMTLLSAQAKDYTDQLIVSVDGAQATPSKSTISINQETDGTYSLQLKNFVLVSGEDSMYVGTINISGVESTNLGTATLLGADDEIVIENGDDPNQTWLGPFLNEVPISMVGLIQGDKFRTVINIEFSGMYITVEFGSGYQLPNSGFEYFHDINAYNTQEANGWHMFYSGTGQFYTVSAQMFQDRVNYSDIVRPGSTGEKSLLLTSYNLAMFKIVANGTATTGRLNVDAMSTDVSKNYSFNDMSKTDVDDNGDPFYASVTNRPDSLVVWVKFNQETPQEVYKYASVSAILNDGTEYRDPENADYNSGVVAKATNNTIESNGNTWQRLSIPFDYDRYAANNAEPKAMLVTLSTNAEAGKGSTDSLYVDDIELVYNGKLASLKYDGQDIDGFTPDTEELTLACSGAFDLNKLEAVADGRGALIAKEIEEVDEATGEGTANVAVFSADLKTMTFYEINFTQPTGIHSTETAGKVHQTEFFNAAGQRINAAAHGLNIVRQNGKVIKIMKK